MGSSGGSSNTTTIQKADPWSGQQPYLRDIFAEAKKLYDSGGLSVDYYPGSPVAPQSGWTAQALQMQADRALGGSASVQAAPPMPKKTISAMHQAVGALPEK